MPHGDAFDVVRISQIELLQWEGHRMHLEAPTKLPDEELALLVTYGQSFARQLLVRRRRWVPMPSIGVGCAGAATTLLPVPLANLYYAREVQALTGAEGEAIIEALTALQPQPVKGQAAAARFRFRPVDAGGIQVNGHVLFILIRPRVTTEETVLDSEAPMVRIRNEWIGRSEHMSQLLVIIVQGRLGLSPLQETRFINITITSDGSKTSLWIHTCSRRCRMGRAG
mmetsp:Transcript_33938/g.72127  ORF Transcript_33938/g.72127 Transcript_33938/m.72127 type:complete len:226 (-) Transcript_33938:139-816(-)